MTDDHFPITIGDATVTLDVKQNGELEVHVENDEREYWVYDDMIDYVYEQAIEQGDIDVP